MSKYTGRQDFTGPKDKRPNKGVAARMKEIKRDEAQARDIVSEHSALGRKARAGELDPALYITHSSGLVGRRAVSA